MNTRFIFCLICISCFGALLATPASAEVFKPSLKAPSPDSVDAGDYYTLLLKWTQNAEIGGTSVSITYMDPEVLIAKQKQSASPDNGQSKALKAFPKRLQVRVTYSSPSKSGLSNRTWQTVVLHAQHPINPKSKTMARQAHLASTAKGDRWRKTVLYEFANANNELLPPKAKALRIRVSNGSNSAQVLWPFVKGAVKAKAKPGGYVQTVGWVLIAWCLLIVIALFVTRPAGKKA